MDQQKPVLNYTPLKLPLINQHESHTLPLPIFLGLVVTFLCGIIIVGLIVLKNMTPTNNDARKYAVTSRENLAATIAAAAAAGPSGAKKATPTLTELTKEATVSPTLEISEEVTPSITVQPTLIPVTTATPALEQ